MTLKKSCAVFGHPKSSPANFTFDRGNRDAYKNLVVLCLPLSSKAI